MTSPAIQSPPSRFERYAAVSVLVLMGITWPVLDLLANNAELFIARRSSKVEIALIGLVLIVGIPLAGGLLAILPTKLGGRIGNLTMTVAGGSLALLYLDRVPIPWMVATGLALIAGVAFVVAFHRTNWVRLLFRYLSVAPVLILVIFLLATPVGAVLTDQGSGIGAAAHITSPAPVMLIVFDEFPVASLIDGQGDLRSDRYPNFARLAADATWFRNAVTVEQQTEHSVPAILTGSIPSQALTPFAGQYPNNLFTALQGTYELHVNETITQLCPRTLCESAATSSTPITRDVGIVAGHVLLPKGLSANLPPIDTSWGNFEAAVTDFDVVDAFRQQIDNDPRTPLQALTDEIRPKGKEPPLYFVHAVVPHQPWQFLPTGQRYLLNQEKAPGSISPGWGDDEWLVSQAMQRHLLQVQYVDTALGQIIDAMKAAGIYDDALMIVVADHGLTLRAGVEHQRQIETDTVGSIAAIPLFVKAPGHPGGVIDDRRAETIDILPTIVDVIGGDLRWETDGTSLFGPDPGRSETTTIGPFSEATFGVTGDEKLVVATQIEAWMPGGDPWALVPPGAPDLRGETPDPEVPESTTLSAFVDRPSWYRIVETSGDVIPARVTGRINGVVDGNIILAVSINGTIGAMTRTFLEDGLTQFQVMLPPGLFVDGENAIAFFQVTDSGDLLSIRR